VKTCFALLPFGVKHDAATGTTVDFERVFAEILKPAAERAGLMLVRADSGSISSSSLTKQVLAGVMSSDLVLADITTADPDVMYELGVRHALNRGPTVLLSASARTPPFDLGYLRIVRYEPRDVEASRAQLIDVLSFAARSSEGSPIYEFFPSLHVDLPADLQPAATTDAVDAAEATAEANLPSPLDTLRALRKQGDWDKLIQTADALPAQAKNDPQVQQLLALTLNRRAGPGDQDRAVALMTALRLESPDDPEVLGILGRIHKDRWKTTGAEADLREAASAYAQAFAVQSTDYYAGFNAASLLFLQATPDADADLAGLLPRVKALVAERLSQKGPDDFWAINVATELAVIERDWGAAREFARRQVAASADPWMLTSGVESLQRLGRRLTGADAEALAEIVGMLAAAAGTTRAPRA